MAKNIKVMKEFRIGSSYFFSEYNDYVLHDIDTLCIMDGNINGEKSFILRKDGKDFILYPPMEGRKYIENDLKTNDPIKVGKYLSKEFAEYINMTIDDLKKLESTFSNLDEKHQYEKVIYDAYIENNDFILNDEQRMKAYMEYKKAREKEYIK